MRPLKVLSPGLVLPLTMSAAGGPAALPGLTVGDVPVPSVLSLVAIGVVMVFLIWRRRLPR